MRNYYEVGDRASEVSNRAGILSTPCRNDCACVALLAEEASLPLRDGRGAAKG
jgi:hypothetical protein